MPRRRMSKKARKKAMRELDILTYIIVGVCLVILLIYLAYVFATVDFSTSSLFGEENTVKYYFDEYDAGGEEWAIDPEEMCDGDTGRWAQTNLPWEPPAQDLVQRMTANTCEGTELGNITKVEIRAKVDGPYSPPDINYVTLRPMLDGEDGSDFQITVMGTTWSEWFDITTDVNAYSIWTWDDIVNLDCDVEADVGLSFIKCAIVELQVSFETETPPPPTHTIEITVLNSKTSARVSGAEVTINDEMKHTDGGGQVEFTLVEGSHIVTIDRYDMNKGIEVITIPYDCPAVTFYLTLLENGNGNGNGENGDATIGFEAILSITALGIAFILLRKRRRQG